LTLSEHCTYHVPPLRSHPTVHVPIMPRLTASQTIWIVILAVALTVRLAAGMWWQSRLPAEQKFFFPDSLSYWELGKMIAMGQDYEYLSSDARVFRTPGYPLLLAGLFRIFGDNPPVIAARALSAVMGTVAVGIVGWWTTQLFDARAGHWAGWIAALYPGGVSMGAFVLAETPFCPFMLLHLALWGLASRTVNSQRATTLAFGGGIAGAVATLIRPSWLLFMPLALVVGLAVEKNRLRQLLIGLAMSASFALCMIPWWVRNAHVTGHFVATTLQTGASLYDGLNPAADGSSQMDFVAGFEDQEHVADGAAGAETFEYRLDRRLASAAVDWARANPGRVVELAWIKFLRTWNVWPNEPAFRSWPVRMVVLLTYAPLLVLGLVGAWRFTRSGWPYVLAWMPAVYFTLLHVVFVGSLRYREPAMLALVVLAAGVLAGSRPSSVSVAPLTRFD
jgi:4-amino-4-deoxy-L-arabinose transferase-like glycosyltransferase